MVEVTKAVLNQEQANSLIAKRSRIATELKNLGMQPGDEFNIAASLAEKLGNTELAKDLVAGKSPLSKSPYSTLISKMLASHCETNDISQTIADLEDQVNIFYDEKQCDFKEKIDKPLIRKWIVDTVIDQIEKGGIKLDNKDKKVVSQCMIGAEEFDAFLSSNKMGKVGKLNWDKLCGDQNGKYVRDSDALPLDEFSKKIRDKVLVFCQRNVSKMMEYFDPENNDSIILVKESEMADQVQGTLSRLIKANIWKDYPVIVVVINNDGKEVEDTNAEARNEKTRNDLLQQAEQYIKEGKLEELMGLDKDGKVAAKEDGTLNYDYLQKIKDTELFKFIYKYRDQIKLRIKENNNDVEKGMKKNDIEDMYADAGFAIFDNDETDSVVASYVKDDGRKKDFQDIDLQNDYVRKAFLEEITDFGTKGVYSVDGFSTYAPDYVDYRIHIQWYKKTGEVEKAVKGKLAQEEAKEKEAEEKKAVKPK